MEEKDPFEFAFRARDVFLTGATGMLGTALLVKITKDTTISHIHILVRGGEGKLPPYDATMLGY
jgi:FlaA1/EpsC-like NDP-sugar epimerase